MENDAFEDEIIPQNIGHEATTLIVLPEIETIPHERRNIRRRQPATVTYLQGVNDQIDSQNSNSFNDEDYHPPLFDSDEEDTCDEDSYDDEDNDDDDDKVRFVEETAFGDVLSPTLGERKDANDLFQQRSENLLLNIPEKHALGSYF